MYPSLQLRRRGRTCATATLLVAAAVALGGCAAKAPMLEMYWPDPPDKPRIRFVQKIESKQDVSGPSLRQILVGENEMVSLYQPMGLTLSDDGQRLYVVDRVWNAVFVFDLAQGAFSTIGTEERYPLELPVAVALDAQENVYVSDTGTHSVRVYDPAGRFQRAIGKDVLKRPTGVALDKARRRLYVVDTGASESEEGHRVYIFDLEGQIVAEIGHRGDGDGEFNFPTFANLDAEGRLYVVDSINFRIQVFNPEGKFLFKLGRAGDAIGDFAAPKGVAVDTFGNIYVVDSRWSNVQIFDARGRLLLVFGGVGTYPGLLMNPTAIVIDQKNRIYVSDTLGKRVSVYQLLDATGEDNAEAQGSTSGPAGDEGG